MDRIDDGLETKAGAGGDIAALFAEFSSAFEEFKATNDQRLKEIEKRGSADGLLDSSYSYDENGNRLSHTTTSGTTSGSYDAQDRLTS